VLYFRMSRRTESTSVDIDALKDIRTMGSPTHTDETYRILERHF
jgi:hypothetical protein